MQFAKGPLTFRAQAELLIARGLVADVDELTHCLEAVNYYRFAGYVHPFTQSDGTIRRGTTFDMVWRRYRFDRQLRFLVLDGIERVEVAARTQVVYHLAHAGGPFCYVERSGLPNLRDDEFQMFHEKLGEEVGRSKEVFVRHFFDKYGANHAALPLWMLAEILNFGQLLTLFKGVHVSVRRQVSAYYQLPEEVLHSWLRSLNAVRNVCAHHQRLGNRVLGYRPLIPRPRKNPAWHRPYPIANDRLFCIVVILRQLLRKIAERSQWPLRIERLLAEYDDIPLAPMGFRAEWQSHPLWRGDGEL